MVGCAIFEIRAGFPILEERASYFGRDGQPKNEKEEQLARVLVKAYKTSIRAKIGDTALDAKHFHQLCLNSDRGFTLEGDMF